MCLKIWSHTNSNTDTKIINNHILYIYINRMMINYKRQEITIRHHRKESKKHYSSTHSPAGLWPCWRNTPFVSSTLKTQPCNNISWSYFFYVYITVNVHWCWIYWQCYTCTNLYKYHFLCAFNKSFKLV